MKKELLHGVIASIVVVSLAGFVVLAPMPAKAGELAPRLVVVSPMVKMDKKATICILGSGFTPGQELALLITDVDGVPSDIGGALKPVPKANERGAWYTTWSCGRFIDKKLVKEGAYAITVTDGDYNPLAHVPVAFYKAEEKKK